MKRMSVQFERHSISGGEIRLDEWSDSRQPRSKYESSSCAQPYTLWCYRWALAPIALTTLPTTDQLTGIDTTDHSLLAYIFLTNTHPLPHHHYYHSIVNYSSPFLSAQPYINCNHIYCVYNVYKNILSFTTSFQ